MTTRTLTAALAGAVLGLASHGALALESDASQPIKIAADQLRLDDNAGTAVYLGEVDMQQGSMHLTAARVEIERNAQGEVSTVTAYGSDGERAYLEQKPAPDAPLAKGWGETVIYHAAERRVELIDNAELHQAGDTFNGAYVEYFLDRRQVRARSDDDGKGDQRVRMTLTPRNGQ